MKRKAIRIYLRTGLSLMRSGPLPDISNIGVHDYQDSDPRFLMIGQVLTVLLMLEAIVLDSILQHPRLRDGRLHNPRGLKALHWQM